MGSFRSATLTAAAIAVAGIPFAALVAGAGPSSNQLPPEKLAQLRAIEQERSDAEAAPRPAKNLAVTMAAPEPEPAWLTGIIQSGQAPLPASSFTIENQWHDIVGGEHVNIYAGSYRTDPSQGVLVLQTTALDLASRSSPGGVYETPMKAGSLRIVAATRSALTLEAASGARFSFDVSIRELTAL